MLTLKNRSVWLMWPKPSQVRFRLMTLPPQNVALTNCFNSGKGNVDEERKTRPLHAGVQAGSGTASGVWPEHSGGSPQPWSCGADARELGQGASRGEVEGGQRQGRGYGGADGDQLLARGACAGDDGARHPGKSHGILCATEAIAVIQGGCDASLKMREGPSNRLAGAGFKPPQAALVKSHCGERCGKRQGDDFVRCGPRRRTQVNH